MKNHRRWSRITSATVGVVGLLAGCGGATQPAAPPPSGALPGGAVLLGSGPTVKPDPPAPPLRVNQLGYVPSWPKLAVWVSAENAPKAWQLLDGSGKAVASGQTTPKGLDADSGDPVHQVDFSSYRGEGRAYTLAVGSDVSPPFDIRTDLYAQLKSDAVWYFYHNRSGIALELPTAGDTKWTRPAGHLSDREVRCAPKEKLFPGQLACDYALDVSGGWYDAGDQGKYVVNGGIAAFTLLNLYERLQHRAPSSLADYGDGKLRVPEAGNGVPDLLDEARWEVEWMLKMQVPVDKPQAGMAHHKIHDEKWTSMGTIPPSDTATIKTPRYLRPVSTAATLNLAAVAAQAHRIWMKLDPDFARRSLEAAERAWVAAKANPTVLAPSADTIGGGPYEDSQLGDEFYWAATELFISTGKAEYRKEMEGSKFHQELPLGPGAETFLTWQSVAGAATLSLAVVPSDLGEAGLTRARQQLLRHADAYLKVRDQQGYRLPFASIGGKYPWGSNSFVLNNTLVLALAHDVTGDAKYLAGAIDGMGYILGINGMGQSYVTGYGTRPLENPHHRFWAHELGPAFPAPPPGCVSGGPNSAIQDPVMQEAGLAGCKPQKCFIDRLDAYSVNEITINWNAPLAWVTAYLDEQAKRGAAK